ncbi:hypothetical protein R9T26_15800 [Escherichia coli]
MENIFSEFESGNEIYIHPSVLIDKSVKVNVQGSGHKITIDEGVVLRNLRINIIGENNTLHIKKRAI